MVRKNNHPKCRLAFSMIELIFAIVVIAVSVMSLPMMTQINSKGMEDSLVQEAIFASVSEINVASSAMWDDNSIVDENGTYDIGVSKTINIGAKCSGAGGLYKCDGHIKRQCKILNTVTTPSLSNFHDYSLEYFVHDWENIYIDNSDDSEGEGSAAGYKTQYISKLDINWCNGGGCDVQFGATANNANLKEIVVTIANEDNETITLLRSYSAKGRH